MGIEIRSFVDMLERSKARYSEHTIRAYTEDLISLLTYAVGKSLALSEVQWPDIEGYLVECRERGISSRTLARRIICFRSFYSFCRRKGWVKLNPAKGVVPPLYEAPLPNILDEEEVGRLLAAQSGASIWAKRDLAVICTLLGSGLRVSELVALDAGDVSEGGRISLRPLRRSGEIVLDEVYAKVLTDYAVMLPGKEMPLFVNQRYKRITTRSIERIIKRLVRVANLRGDISPRALRHTLAAQLQTFGAAAEQLEDVLGFKCRGSALFYKRQIAKARAARTASKQGS